MEPLEIRCNLSVFDPSAGALAEPVQVPCDVVEEGFYAPSHDSAYGAMTNVRLDVTVTDTQSAPSPEQNGSNINISSFAGQTVRIRIEAADASTASQAAGGQGDDVLLGGSGADVEPSSDDNNHGTHVAGTIGAVGNNGVGLSDDGELDIVSDSDGDDSTHAYRRGYVGWVRLPDGG